MLVATIRRRRQRQRARGRANGQAEAVPLPHGAPDATVGVRGLAARAVPGPPPRHAPSPARPPLDPTNGRAYGQAEAVPLPHGAPGATVRVRGLAARAVPGPPPRHAPSPARQPLDLTVPSYDPERTELLARLPPRRLLLLVDALPPARSGDTLRARNRVTDLLRCGPWMESDASGWKAYLYVRGAEPPPAAVMIHPPRAVVFALFQSTIIYLETLSPAGDETHSAEGQRREEALLGTAQWATNHLPV